MLRVGAVRATGSHHADSHRVALKLRAPGVPGYTTLTPLAAAAVTDALTDALADAGLADALESEGFLIHDYE